MHANIGESSLFFWLTNMTWFLCNNMIRELKIFDDTLLYKLSQIMSKWTVSIIYPYIFTLKLCKAAIKLAVSYIDIFAPINPCALHPTSKIKGISCILKIYKPQTTFLTGTCLHFPGAVSKTDKLPKSLGSRKRRRGVWLKTKSLVSGSKMWKWLKM